jgi:hypothetical protein
VYGRNVFKEYINNTDFVIVELGFSRSLYLISSGLLTSKPKDVKIN